MSCLRTPGWSDQVSQHLPHSDWCCAVPHNFTLLGLLCLSRLLAVAVIDVSFRAAFCIAITHLALSLAKDVTVYQYSYANEQEMVCSTLPVSRRPHTPTPQHPSPELSRDTCPGVIAKIVGASICADNVSGRSRRRWASLR